MKILHVIPSIAARYGGPSTVVMGCCRELEAAGHEVLIATTDADGAGRLPVVIGETTVFEGLRVIFFPRRLGDAFKWSPGLRSWLSAHVADFDVVDVHAVFSHSSIAAGRACRSAAVPYVVRPHGSLDPWSMTRRPALKRLLLKSGVRTLLERAAAIQYTTADEQRLAEAQLLWLAHGEVVPLAIDDSCFAPAPSPDRSQPPYILVMSRLDLKKGLELLIEAFHDVTARAGLEEWRLIIAGAGAPPYEDALRQHAARGPAGHRISFPGWVTGDAKAALLRGAALFASPSEQENFGLAIVEALAAGVPALVTPGVNLAPDIAAADAGWVVVHEPDAFRAALASILESSGERQRRGGAARVLARRFTWARSTAELSALYHRVAVGTRPALTNLADAGIAGRDR